MAWAKANPGFTVGIDSLGDVDTIAVAVQKGNKDLLDWINNEIKELGKENFFHEAYKATLEPILWRFCWSRFNSYLKADNYKNNLIK